MRKKLSIVSDERVGRRIGRRIAIAVRVLEEPLRLELTWVEVGHRRIRVRIEFGAVVWQGVCRLVPRVVGDGSGVVGHVRVLGEEVGVVVERLAVVGAGVVAAAAVGCCGLVVAKGLVNLAIVGVVGSVLGTFSSNTRLCF